MSKTAKCLREGTQGKGSHAQRRTSVTCTLVRRSRAARAATCAAHLLQSPKRGWADRKADLSQVQHEQALPQRLQNGPAQIRFGGVHLEHACS